MLSEYAEAAWQTFFSSWFCARRYYCTDFHIENLDFTLPIFKRLYPRKYAENFGENLQHLHRLNSSNYNESGTQICVVKIKVIWNLAPLQLGQCSD